jgi:hypothetical protein
MKNTYLDGTPFIRDNQGQPVGLLQYPRKKIVSGSRSHCLYILCLIPHDFGLRPLAEYYFLTTLRLPYIPNLQRPMVKGKNSKYFRDVSKHNRTRGPDSPVIF